MGDVVRKPGPSGKHLRELQLVALGASLAHSDRERVAGTLVPGSLSVDLEHVFDGIRKNEAGPLRSWLETRGAYLENSKDAIQCVCEAILAEANRQEVQRILGRLNAAKHTDSPQRLAEELEVCAKRLREL